MAKGSNRQAYKACRSSAKSDEEIHEVLYLKACRKPEWTNASAPTQLNFCKSVKATRPLIPGTAEPAQLRTER